MFCQHVCLCTVCIPGALGSPEAGMTDSCEPLGRCWEWNSSLPAEQTVLLTTEPPLQSQSVMFKVRVLLCSPGWPWMLNVAQGSFQFLIFLPLPPQCEQPSSMLLGTLIYLFFILVENDGQFFRLQTVSHSRWGPTLPHLPPLSLKKGKWLRSRYVLWGGSSFASLN